MMLISWFQPFPISSGYLPVRHCPTANRVAASTPSGHPRHCPTASRVAASTPSGHPRHCPTASRVAASTPSGRLRQSTTNPTTTFTQSPPRWKEPLLPTWPELQLISHPWRMPQACLLLLSLSHTIRMPRVCSRHQNLNVAVRMPAEGSLNFELSPITKYLSISQTANMLLVGCLYLNTIHTV